MRGDEFFQTISREPPFTKLHPRVAAFFKGYFSREKGDRDSTGTTSSTRIFRRIQAPRLTSWPGSSPNWATPRRAGFIR